MDIKSLQQIKNEAGVGYIDYRSTLSINRQTIYRDLFVIWAAILLGFAANLSGILASVVGVALSMFWFSFWKHSFMLFFHEAAHFNLHPVRKHNDRLANIFFTPFVGQWIATYRANHWQHHQKLGTEDDPENTYQSPLTLLSIVSSLTGWYLLKSVLRYANLQKSKSPHKNKQSNSKSNLWSFCSGLGVLVTAQLILCVALYYWISPYCSLAWALSIFITDPFVMRIRQTLEHRDSERVERGVIEQPSLEATNKIFGSDWFSRFFGGAGFNKHLIHHMDPSVSYTRFDEVINFLESTEANEYVRANSSTYFKRLLEVLGEKRS